jgi:polyisoprenoid-binding protein YceI
MMAKWIAVALCAVGAGAADRAIDTKTSTMTVRVGKAGAFSAFGHDHVIEAPIAGGIADSEAHRVELRVAAAALRVNDPKASESDRAAVQKTMLGPAVLDSVRFPEITFQSTAATQSGAGAWSVTGNLTLHGETRPMTVAVKETGGRYMGNATIKQTEFGIKPVKVAGGTVKVKDEVRIEFEISLK